MGGDKYNGIERGCRRIGEGGILSTKAHLVFVVEASHFSFPVLLIAIVSSDGG